jgi:Family of unknown function (DUF5522)
MSHNDKDMKSKNNEVYFYMENGLIVFTEAYHRKKGYCCKHGCRHCPYGFRKGKETDSGTKQAE